MSIIPRHLIIDTRLGHWFRLGEEIFCTRMGYLTRNRYPWELVSRFSTLRSGLQVPKHPIVLCHGLFGGDRYGLKIIPWSQVHYWGRIARFLQERGCRVLVTKVSRCASIETRATELRQQIRNGQLGDSVNIIAHSMGGLDARYLIAHLSKMHDDLCIKSLTTIGTPHRGSSIADWCYRQARNRRRTERLFKFLGIDSIAFHNLSTNFMINEFNPSTPDHPAVAYFSYGAQADIPVWSPLGVSCSILKNLEGPNDGLVSVNSAKWGTYLGTVQADHWDLIDRWNLQKGHFDTIQFYLNVIQMLHDRGF